MAPMRQSRQRPDGREGSPRPFLRRGLTIAGALALAALSGAVSIAGITRNDRPDIALLLLPFDAVANARMADILLQSQPPGPRDQIIAHAQASLVRTPLSPSAARILGLVAGDQAPGGVAERRIRFADRLSRRDLGTNLWLIEEAVKRNDVAGALDRYDIALRTTPLAHGVLYPVLAGALADSEFVEPFIAMTRRRNPTWLADFLPWALQKGGATENVAAIVSRLPAAWASRDRILAVTTLGQLVGEKRFAAAARFLDAPVAQAAGSGGLVSTRRLIPLADGRGLAPFSWSLAASSDLGAEADGTGASAWAGNGTTGAAVSRLLALPPGTYRLRAGWRSIEGEGSAAWTLTCAGEEGRYLSTLRAPSVAVLFQVSADCPAQTLQLVLTPGTSSSELKVSVSNPAIDPALQRTVVP